MAGSTPITKQLRLHGRVQSDEEAIQRMLAWAQRIPKMAQITEMEVEESSGCYVEFERRVTA